MTEDELKEIRASVMRRGDGETGCLRCGVDEWRINGYCSCPCEDLAEREADIARLLEEVERLRNPFIAVADSMPPSGRLVFAAFVNSYGMQRIVRAFWADTRDVEVPEDPYETCDHDEESGIVWLHPGWYEECDGSEDFYAITDEVTHWMPMPESPARAALEGE